MVQPKLAIDNALPVRPASPLLPPSVRSIKAGVLFDRPRSHAVVLVGTIVTLASAMTRHGTALAGALVGARGLDMAGLLALVADTLVGRLRGAVAREMADLAA